MRPSDTRPHCGTVAVLATMHSKEQVIASLLEQGLGLRVEPANGLDTDRIGTFSRDIERTGTPLEAARSKTAAAFDHAPDTRRVCGERSQIRPASAGSVPVARQRTVPADRS